MKEVKNTILDDFLHINDGNGKDDMKSSEFIGFGPKTRPKPLSGKLAREIFRDECKGFPSIHRKKPTFIIYEYSTIKYTIREKRGIPVFKICDIYLFASEVEFRAISRKMFRHYSNRRNTASDEKLYKEFTRRPEVEERWREIRLKRGTGKSILPPRGRFHNLTGLADNVVERYFREDFPLPRLGWSKKKAKRRFGHYDKDHNTVVVSRILDSREVPPYLVEYILYHEFLHIKHGITVKGSRSYVHTKGFHNDEKNFYRYGEAKRLLKKIANGKI